MNDQKRHDGLPMLSDEAIARIEEGVFAEIAAEPRTSASPAAARSRARRRRWLTGIGVAAAFAVGVLVTPPILALTGSSSATSTADGVGFVGGAPLPAVPLPGQGSAADRSAGSETAESSAVVPGEIGEEGRDIVATANASIEVEDIAEAADDIAALAEQYGGYVESTDVGRSGVAIDSSAPGPSQPDYGWVSIRVPSADLTAVIDDLDETGEVLSSSISRQDVTATAVDLRARVEASQASVQRLTELLSQSASVSELIEAEVALTDRQAELESYQQQLSALEDQVAMSTLQVQLTPASTTTSADPAGFGDGLLAGWNGLIVSLNALVIAVGFVLPWAAIAGAVVLVVWLVRRARARRRDDADPLP